MSLRMTLRLAASAITIAGLIFAQAQPKPKSQKEAEAIMAVFNAQDPDARIAAAEKLLTTYADTEFKSVALLFAAESARQKNDFEKMVIYAERTLEADAKSYPAMLMLANGIAQRTREHDLDKEEKLGKAEKYAKDAMEVIKNSAKPRPDITDEQWEGAKRDYTAQAYEAIGIIAMVRKKYDDAIANFKLATENNPNADPGALLRMAAAYNASNKPDAAILTIDKLLATPNLHPQLKQIAEAEKDKASKLKSGAVKAAPAAAAGPAQVEIKK